MKTIYVLPFVNCNDPTWLSVYEKAYRKQFGLPKVRVMRERFQVFDYFKYVFRGIENCYPWIDEVVLILAQPSQFPLWLNPENIKVIYHDQFMPSNILPTYNSSTIEAFLPDLPIDTDFIIYGNDDFYPISPLSFDKFFNQSGYPCLKMLNHAPTHLSGFRRLCQEMWINCCKTFNIEVDLKDDFKMPNHDMQPINYQLMLQAKNQFSNFMYSHLEPFRGPHQNNQYIFANYAYLTNQYAPSTRRFKYFTTGVDDIDTVANYIANKQCDTLVLNDGGIGYDLWVSNPKILEAFDQIFPNKSKYEL